MVQRLSVRLFKQQIGHRDEAFEGESAMTSFSFGRQWSGRGGEGSVDDATTHKSLLLSLSDFYVRAVGLCCCALLGHADPDASFESSPHQPTASTTTVCVDGDGGSSSSCEGGDATPTTAATFAPLPSSSLDVPEDLFINILTYVSSKRLLPDPQ